MKQQTLFSGHWIQTVQVDIGEPSKPKLRWTQPTAFRALKDADYAILNTPQAGVRVWLSFSDVLQVAEEPRATVYHCGPADFDCRNFVQDYYLKIPGVRKLIDWVVQHNLCHTQSKDTIKRLVSFLRGKHTSLGDRVLICTHATLAHTYKRLKRRRKLSLLKNTLIWIDEAHHVMNAQVADSKATVSNQIGGLVKYCATSGI